MDIIDGFNALGIDTGTYASGKHYVKCPQDECTSRKKKSKPTLLIDFTTGHYECFHCSWKGFALSGNTQKETPKFEPPPLKQQKFLPEIENPWIFIDTTIDPPPADPRVMEGQYTITFYYRNIHGKITTAKRMLYNFSGKEMKRDKDSPPLFTTTRDNGFYPCLFNEHMLTLHPKATVVLVESEKTACMMTHKLKSNLDEFIFLATGGTKGLTDDKVPVLKDRNVWIVYDCDNGETLADGQVKNPKGREGAVDVYEKLQKICSPRIIDIDPQKSDGTDLADIYDKVNIDFVRKLSELIPERIRSLWDKLIVKQRPPYTPPLISINGTPICTPSNLSLIVGKKKSRKSLFIILMLYWYFSDKRNDPRSVILFDTEQGENEIFDMVSKVLKMTGITISIFYLRGESHKERLKIIKETVQYWPIPVKLLFIDGTRDLMGNINDADESTEIIEWMTQIIVKSGVHIVNVLHLNKTDNNARGHIGSELLNKAQTTIELELDKSTGLTMVKCESSRGKPFDDFAFTHDKDDLPEIVGIPVNSQEGEVLNQAEKRKRLLMIFGEDSFMVAKTFTEEVKAHFDLGITKAKALVAEFRRNGWVVMTGSSRKKDLAYRIVISENGALRPEPPSQQEELFTLKTDEDLPF